MQTYHEASVLNLLEVMLYHRTACMAADDVLVELIDYCYRKFVSLIEKCSKLGDGEYIFPSKKPSKSDTALNPEQEQDNSFEQIEWNCVMACFSIIRFISDHTESLPVPIIH